ncbi:hypothetical protein OBBRIDRAFT_826247 [Obba rivulosa]|uniref:Uncharacterized protein n=1 Tax=Obba rivulosa TaxID=1052685 RepID=A0A8E2AXC7_9APHY|nr:hypothetical protein OBBRIDRAFT_826247 [Obba rivulosa]
MMQVEVVGRVTDGVYRLYSVLITAPEQCQKILVWFLWNVLFMRFPDFYAGRINSMSDDGIYMCDHGEQSIWDAHVKEYTNMAGASVAIVSLSISLLATSFGSANNMTFTCGVCATVVSLIASSFSTFYFLGMQLINSANHQRRILQTIREQINRSNWNGPGLILAAPAAWLAWSSISLLVFVVSGIWPAPASSMAFATSLDPSLCLTASILLGTVIVCGVSHLLLCMVQFAKLKYANFYHSP